MNNNPLIELEKLGQSIWVDFLGRDALDNGELQRMIAQDGVSGLTSNPSIFEKSIMETKSYDSAINALARAGKSVKEMVMVLTVADIQRAADLFRPVYDQMEGNDGYVSLELTSTLARDTAGSIAEARVLWKAVNRPNLFIKVPGTRPGLPVIQQLIGEGINVNITLLFGLPRYREVAGAYLAGLESLAASGQKPLSQMASVASFFLSRIDTLIDPQLEKIQQAGGPNAETAGRLRGQIATASAKVAYQMYNEIFNSERFLKLKSLGARPQRLLWASTSTKNPEYSDVKYIEPLIGRDTINTVPVETLAVYRDHGKPGLSLEDGVQAAVQVLEDLKKVGISLDQVTQQLEDEGVAKFNKSTEQLNAGLEKKRAALTSSDKVRS